MFVFVFLPEPAHVRVSMHVCVCVFLREVCVCLCVCILWPLGLPVSHWHEVNPTKAVLVLSNSSLAHGRLSQGDLRCLWVCERACSGVS